MKGFLLFFALFFLVVPGLHAEELTVDLRFEASSVAPPGEAAKAAVKGLKGVRVHSFTDKRRSGETFLGELKINGQMQKVHSKAALSVYATDAFSKFYGEFGGKISPDGPLSLKGEVTQFEFEEGDGYQAKVGVHFYLLDESGRIIWDGHSSGIMRGTGGLAGAENLNRVFSYILRATYVELLEDEKLIGVWSGKVSNTYVIRDEAQLTANTRNGQ